jgi:predicted small secreted protein
MSNKRLASIARLIVVTLIGTAALLSARHTTGGAGEHIAATANALTNSVEKHAPQARMRCRMIT